MATLTIDPEVSPRLITIAAPDTTITVQEIVNWCREWEMTIDGMVYDRLINANGKQSLSGVKSVGITAVFQNTKIEFEARSGPSYAECYITDGNLLAIDDVGASMAPLNPTAYVFATVELDTSAAIVETGVSGLTPTESTQLTDIHNELDTIEGTYSHSEVMKLLLAALSGKLTGAGTTNVKIYSEDGSTVRIDATVDQYGNRSSRTLDTS